MKPIALLAVLAAVTACARPESTSNDADGPAATTASEGHDAPPGEAAKSGAPAASAPAPSTSDAGSAPPADARGIAVGEPHPSGDVPVDAGPARYDGYGALRFGMSVAQVREAWQGALQGDEVKPDNCAYLRPAGTAAGPYLMFEQGRFVRYDIQGTNTTAPGGGRVGLAADDIRRMYAGRVSESPHQYVEGGKYLRVADPASNARALVFEVDAHGRVTAWRGGQTPQVGYVEGCS